MHTFDAIKYGISEVLIVAKCNVNVLPKDLKYLCHMVLIVAKCNVNKAPIFTKFECSLY